MIKNLGPQFVAGNNAVKLVHTGEGELPYSMTVAFRTQMPANGPKVVVDLTTSIERDRLKMGETVRVVAKVTNKTGQGQPMTLVRVGIPGGTTFQNWQLKELMEKKLIAFYETRPREVILYFRQLEPNAVKEIPIDLVCVVPGQYTGPASNAYLYYTNDQKVWADPLKVTITR